jgi:HK97 family phage portal protein
MILEEGGKLDDGLMSAQDAQFLETRKFERSDIAMFFGVPPHMIGDTEKSTSWGTGIEQQGTGFVQYTGIDWFTMWEQALARDCLTDVDRAAGVFIKIDARGLMRGDFKARSEAYARALGSGGQEPWMEVNEVRSLEDLEPVTWGDGRPTPSSSPQKPGADPGNENDPQPPPEDA